MMPEYTHVVAVVMERCAYNCITQCAKHAANILLMLCRQRARERRQHQVDNLYVINGEVSSADMHTCVLTCV
jgi:hypothetical protein